jgi:hypothetical protein
MINSAQYLQARNSRFDRYVYLAQKAARRIMMQTIDDVAAWVIPIISISDEPPRPNWAKARGKTDGRNL